MRKTGIGSYAFSGCSGLTGTLTIPNSVTSIGSDAFSYCSGLTNVVLEDGSATLSFGTSSDYPSVFQNCPIGSLYLGRDISYSGSGSTSYSPFKNKTTLTSLTIGSSVTSVGDYAFSGCSGLTGTLTIPNSVTSIGSAAFEGCSSLSGSLILPNAITSISASSFQNCSSLTSVTIPCQVTAIGSSAFAGCSGLTEINSKNSTPPAAQSNAFEGVDKTACTLYVPVGSSTDYWLHPVWEDFTNRQEQAFDPCLSSQTITFNTIPTKTYGDVAFTLSGSSSSGLPVTFTSSNTAVATISNSTLTITGAGTATITATQAGNANYDAASVSQTLTVDKAPLTITADDATRPFGQANPVFTLSYSGFVNGDNESVLDVLPTIICNADDASPAGSYSISLSGGSDNNYIYALVDGELEVTQVNGIEDIGSDTDIYVYVTSNGVRIKGCNPQDRVSICNAAGQMVYSTAAGNGWIDCSLQRGRVYIVRTPRKTVKLITNY